MVVILDNNQKSNTTIKQLGPQCQPRQDRQDCGGDKDKKDCGKGDRGEAGRGEGDRTAATIAAARRIKMMNTTLRTTAAGGGTPPPAWATRQEYSTRCSSTRSLPSTQSRSLTLVAVTNGGLRYYLWVKGR